MMRDLFNTFYPTHVIPYQNPETVAKVARQHGLRLLAVNGKALTSLTQAEKAQIKLSDNAKYLFRVTLDPSDPTMSVESLMECIEEDLAE